MGLAEQLLERIGDPSLTHNERTRLRCQLAKALSELGKYEEARQSMGDLWSRVGDRPALERLDQATAGEVLLRVGALTSYIGSANQSEGAQDAAKDLLSESVSIFELLGDTKKVAEAQAHLGYCYSRQGEYGEARIVLCAARSRVTNKDVELKAFVLLLSAIVEKVTARLNDALRIHFEAAPLFEKLDDHALKGKFHNEFGTVLKNLGLAESRADYIDRALVEYAAADFHLGQAGHTRFRACVQNNLGMLFSKIGRFAEAHEYLDRAREILVSLKDKGIVAQVDDTRAKVLLAEGRNVEAEAVAHAAVQTLEKGDERSHLAEAMVTHGTALARTGKHEWARMTLECAALVAEQAGHLERAGDAALTVIEELGEQSAPAEMCAVYERAAELLAGSRDPAIPARMAACARRVVGKLAAQSGQAPATNLQSPAAEPHAPDAKLPADATELQAPATEPQADTAESQAPAAKLAAPANWEGFSFRGEIRRYERLLIEHALKDAAGVVTRAAQLLGFKHHYSLITLMNRRHKDLLPARSPVVPRRRSILRHGGGRAQKAAGGGGNVARPVTILHVEDNKVVADAMKVTLESEGWKVESCADGLSALKRLVGDEPFDLLLLDHELPGLNGIDLLRLARKLPHRRRTPVVMLSASDCEAEAWRAGADAFLLKPKDVSAVTYTISRLLKP